jgi:tubulin---tyrosine ligase
VVNDDGPPGVASPYIAPFVDTLCEAGHEVSVVLPTHNNSGMAKAYNFGKVLQPRRYTAPNIHYSEPWILVDGSPASCVQLGIYHLSQDRAPVDLVVSGPNYGHNLTSVYNLSSGTLGGGLEGALCGKRAVSLSFAFGDHLIPGEDGDHGAELIGIACKFSIRLIERLYEAWHPTVELYHVNVPLLSAPWDPPPVVWTTAVRSSLSSPSIFRPMKATLEPAGIGEEDAMLPMMWAPRFTDVKRSIEKAPPGTDAWALRQGFIGSVDNTQWLMPKMLTMVMRVIPMQAYIREVPGFSGELGIDISI